MSDSVTPRTVVHQAPLSMGFSRQEQWSGLPFPSPGDLPDPGIEPGSPALQADSLPSELSGEPTHTRGVRTQKLQEGTEMQHETLVQAKGDVLGLNLTFASCGLP